MEFSFVLKVPIARDKLRAGERYMEEVIRGDISKAKHESADVLSSNISDDQEELSQRFRLLQWLPEPVRYVFNDSAVELFHFQRIRMSDLFGCFSFAMPALLSLSVFGTRRCIDENTARELLRAGAEELDVLNEELPIFRRYADQIGKKIQKVLSIDTLGDWRIAFKGETTTLAFHVLVDSKYELGDFLIQQMVFNAFRSYLVYLYKSVVLFAPKWQGKAAESSLNDGLTSRASRKDSQLAETRDQALVFDQRIASFEDLKARTNFLGVRDLLKSTPLRSIPESSKSPEVLKADVVFKRGEGPIDYNWNERYFVLYDACIVYFSSPEAREKRGVISLKDVHVGRVAPFSGQEFALKIENPGEDRALWFTCKTRAELLAWKRSILKIVLNVFDETELNFYLEKTEGGAGTSSTDLPGPTPRIAPKLERSDTFQEHRISRFMESPINLSAVENVAAEDDAWEFYKVRNLVKIFALKSQLPLFTPASLLGEIKGVWSRALYCLFLSLAFYYIHFLRYFSFLCGVLTVLAVVFQFWKKTRGATGAASVVLKGKLVFERPKSEVFEYLTNLKHLTKWNATLQSVEIKSINKFEGALKRNELCSGRVNGEMGCNGNAVFFSLRDPEDAFGSLEYIVFRTVESLPGMCEVSYYIHASCKDRRATPRRLIKDTENRLNSLVLLKNELENDYLKPPAKPRQFAESIFYDEQGTFFTRGRPYLESRPRDFVEDMRLVRSELRNNPNTNPELLVSAVEGFGPAQMNTYEFGLVRPDFDFREALFERYLDHLARPKAARLLRVLFPVAVVDNQSVFHKMAESWAFLPVYLGLACKTKKPLKKLQHVVAFAISGLSRLRTSGRLPYIPNAGETFQAFLADGSSLDFEQISPSRSAFLVTDFKGRFTFSGTLSLDIAFHANAVLLEPHGNFRIRFLRRDKQLLADKPAEDFSFSQAPKESPNEGLPATSQNLPAADDELLVNDFIDLKFPRVQVNGLVAENDVVGLNGALKAVYSKGKLSATVAFEDFLYADASASRQAISGAITSLEDGLERSVVSGVFPFSVAFDGVAFWKANLLVPAEILPANRFLPSSVHLREDIYAIAHGKRSNARFLQIELALKNQMKMLVQKFQSSLR